MSFDSHVASASMRMFDLSYPPGSLLQPNYYCVAKPHFLSLRTLSNSPACPTLRLFVGAANPDYDESASVPTNSYRPSRGVSKVQVAVATRFALVTEAKPHGPPSWKVDICPTVRPRNPQSGQLFVASLWSVPSARKRALSSGSARGGRIFLEGA